MINFGNLRMFTERLSGDELLALVLDDKNYRPEPLLKITFYHMEVYYYDSTTRIL